MAADEETGQLVLLRWFDATLAAVSRLDVPIAPVSLRLSADGRSLAVASLWAHRVTLVDVSFGQQEAGGDDWRIAASMADLERQSRVSITSTMQGPEPTAEQAAALAAFVRSLQPPPRLPPSDVQAVDAGGKLFDRLGCQQCHPAPWYTSPGLFDVGMPDENGHREFNPPSLRGLAHRDRYFHDNRAETLFDVFLKHRHQVPNDLGAREVKELTSFLRTL